MMIKGQSGEVLELDVRRRSYENAPNDDDANWLEAAVSIKVPSFNALYGTNLCANDLQSFYENIVKMQTGVLPEVRFTTVEDGLSLQIQQKKTGTLIVSGKTDPGFPNILHFSFKADNIELDHLVSQLNEFLKDYVVIGSPE